MKTQIITLESHDDLVSVRDRMSWAKSPRILLVWPRFEKITLRPLDLRILQHHAAVPRGRPRARHAQRNGSGARPGDLASPYFGRRPKRNVMCGDHARPERADAVAGQSAHA